MISLRNSGRWYAILRAWLAAELGVSRQCAYRWVRRFLDEGATGLNDRSSRPHHCPRRTPASVEAAVVELRTSARRGQQWIADELGAPARTVCAILRRHRMPYLRDCDPLTGAVIRASKTTAVRYERNRPGELIHMDVKKIGRIPDGGGWKAHGRAATGDDHAHKKSHIGFDYVHSVIDDHSRLAYSEILSDEKGITCAAFLQRAADYFATYGITQIERIMTDNAWAYRYSLREVVAALGARQVFIKPHCGRTAKRSATTAPCKSNGPTARSSTPTTPAAQPLLPGSSTTTINGATQPRRQTPDQPTVANLTAEYI